MTSFRHLIDGSTDSFAMRFAFFLSISLAAFVVHRHADADDTPAVDDYGHWAFQPVVRAALPSVSDTSWLQTPIDAFVLARLDAEQLRPSLRADRVTLIRRASLDLVGMLPSREQVEAFLADSSPDAFQQVVDRLLASPQYGERWGQHWLDLARYADSNGFEFDFERPHAWHYRDYVIDSLNTDKPYDRFLIEQLAGDEISPDSFEALVATGFCRNGPTVGNQNLEKNRYDELDDVISTTTEVFLGLTLGCARCHDHKYDPISQRDYYSMLAIFHSMANRDHLIGTPEEIRERSRIDKEIRDAREELKKLSNQPSRGRWRLENGELIQEAMAPNVRLFFGDAEWTDYTIEVEFQKTGGTEEPFNYDAGVCLAVRATELNNFYWAHLGVSDNREHAFEVEHNGGRTPVFPKVAGNVQRGRWYRLRADVRAELIRVFLDGMLLFDIRDSRHRRGGIGLGNWLTTTRWRNLKVSDPQGKIMLDHFPDPAQAIQPAEQSGSTTRDLVNARIADLESVKARLPIAMSVFDPKPQPRVTKLFVRGDHRNPGPIVEPAVPAILSSELVEFPSPPESAKSTGRRRRLAEWLASSENPLTARVMVNRLWQYHFGVGLVETSSNFGVNGTEPSHPRLLDWLAVKFMKSGWSIKHIHRLIMTSSVYQQSAQMRSESEAILRLIDPDNRLLWRFPRRRLEAEVLRDRILAASGTINLQMHGPGVRPRIHPSVIATSTTRKWPTIEREGPEHWRRSVYIFTRRSVRLPMLEAFDAPTTTESCAHRQTTIVPTQALQLMNDAFTNEQAAHMADSVVQSVGNDVSLQVDEVFWRTLARKPSDSEKDDCVGFILEQRSYHASRGVNANRKALADLCHVMYSLNEFVYLD